MPGHDLVVVGSANADLVTTVERHPRPGETLLGSDLEIHAGGKGANQAVAAARLGARAALLARVGDDEHGQLLLTSQRAAGVDATAVLVGDGPTGVALVTVDRSGDNTIVVAPGANHRLSAEDVLASGALLGAAGAVSVQLEIPPEAVAAAVRTATAAGTRVVLNASPPAALPREVLAACDPLVVNEHEARLLLDAGAEVEAEALLGLGPRSVVVTLGARGALVAGDGVRSRVPSPAVRAVDTTGAGDAFTGALAWRLGVGDGLEPAVRFAVRVGAAAVIRVGAQDSFPSPADLPPAEAP